MSTPHAGLKAESASETTGQGTVVRSDSGAAVPGRDKVKGKSGVAGNGAKSKDKGAGKAAAAHGKPAKADKPANRTNP